MRPSHLVLSRFLDEARSGLVHILGRLTGFVGCAKVFRKSFFHGERRIYWKRHLADRAAECPLRRDQLRSHLVYPRHPSILRRHPGIEVA